MAEVKRDVLGRFIKGCPSWNKGVHIFLGGGFPKGGKAWNRGKSIQTNTGRTHFKKGNHTKTQFKKGRKAWNFKDGKILKSYGRNWTGFLKENIRLRDKYKCQICGISQKKYNQTLCIHHINEIKTDLRPNNLITLCRSCHMNIHHKISMKRIKNGNN